MENPCIEFGLRLLRVCGLNLMKDTTKIKTLMATYIMLLGANFVLCALEPILNFQGIEALAASVDATSNFFMVLIRMVVFTLKFPILKEMICIPSFLPMDYLGDAVCAKQLVVYGRVGKAFKLLLQISIGCLIGQFVLPLFLKQRQLPNPCYHVVDLLQSPVYELVYVWQLFDGLVLTLFIIGFDCLLISNLAMGYCQMMMLKHELSNLKMKANYFEEDEEKYFNKLTSLVDKHNSILAFFDKFNKVYSPIILTEFSSTLLNICVALYLIATFGATRLFATIRSVSVVMAYAWVLFIYCVAGSLTTSQYDSIYHALYESKWYMGPSRSPRVRKAIILLIQMSQRKLEIKAGGVFTLDMVAYLTVMKTSYSFYTMLISISKT